jgi:pimeloyl-ACP methyl ester carboxylesterase
MSVHESGAGAPLILLHGFSGNYSRWGRAAELLARSRRVITYDLRGHAESAKAPGLDYSFDAHVEDLAGLMDALGVERATVAGHSMGGMVAQHFALKYPERVEKLVLCATTQCLMRNPAKRAFLNLAMYLLILFPAILGFFVRRKLNTKPAELFPERENPALDFANAALVRCLRAIVNHDLRGAVSRISIPTLVLSSTQDEMIDPALVKALAGEIPGARFEPIQNNTHFVPLEQPETVARVVESFLEQTPTQTTASH